MKATDKMLNALIEMGLVNEWNKGEYHRYYIDVAKVDEAYDRMDVAAKRHGRMPLNRHERMSGKLWIEAGTLEIKSKGIQHNPGDEEVIVEILADVTSDGADPVAVDETRDLADHGNQAAKKSSRREQPSRAAQGSQSPQLESLLSDCTTTEGKSQRHVDSKDNNEEDKSMGKTYSAQLNNKDCAFDWLDDAESIEAVLAWAEGRGGDYSMFVRGGNSPTGGEKLYVEDTDEGTVFAWPDYRHSESFEAPVYCRGTKAQAAEYLRKVL